MSTTPVIITPRQILLGAAAIIWALCVSDYIRGVFTERPGGEAEGLIGFGIWMLVLYWVSKYNKYDWSYEWVLIALVTYAPFADFIDAGFGGILGLRG